MVHKIGTGKRTKLFLDTEFTGLHQYTSLISLGIVSENYETFYVHNRDHNKNQVDDWIRENVLSKAEILHLTPYKDVELKSIISCSVSYRGIKKPLMDYLAAIDTGTGFEVWGDVPAHDWILFQQIFGGAFKMPSSIYYIPFDLATAFRMVGVDPDIDRAEYAAGLMGSDNKYMEEVNKLRHHALGDAIIEMECFNTLNKLYRSKPL